MPLHARRVYLYTPNFLALIRRRPTNQYYVPMQSDTKAGKEVRENPDSYNKSCKHLMANSLLETCSIQGMYSDSKHKKAGTEVARV